MFIYILSTYYKMNFKKVYKIYNKRKNFKKINKIDDDDDEFQSYYFQSN